MRLAALCVFGALLVASDARADDPVVLDRIVATLNQWKVLRSDVILRAGPWLAQLTPEERTDKKRVMGVYREVLDKMVDDLLIEDDAAKRRIRVEDREVDAALDEVGKTYKLDRAGVLAAAEKQGMPAQVYREELRRRLLDARWTQIRALPNVKIPPIATDEERKVLTRSLVEVERRKLLAQMRIDADVELRW
jgi:peptidyl-prolyl cis-trans isomerase SurA